MTPHTRRQAEIARDFIAQYQRETGGASPSFREIARDLGIASAARVHRILVGMERAGMIRRTPYRARSIEVLPEYFVAENNEGETSLRRVVWR